MNKGAFLIIFDRRYFMLIGILFAIFFIYEHYTSIGYIQEDSIAFDIGNLVGWQPPDSSLVEQKILELTNNERINYGLIPLDSDLSLSQIARDHSKNMNDNNFFDHTNPEGEGPSERARNEGIRITNGNWIGIGENIGETPTGNVIGCGYVYSEEDIAKCTVDGWMDSSGHRENILDQNYKVIGVGTYCTTSTCFNTQNFR